jgi:NAD-specific glutamate dehydrogenase
MVQTSLPDDPYLHPELVRYFPTPLRERFAEQIDRHRLRREIIATQIGNQMVNISGISFDHRMLEDTGEIDQDVKSHITREEFETALLTDRAEAAKEAAERAAGARIAAGEAAVTATATL